MKIIDGVVLTQLGDSYVAVASGETTAFHGLIKLNQTGADIWRLLEQGLDKPAIAQQLVEKYDGVDYEHALHDTEELTAVLKQKGILTD